MSNPYALAPECPKCEARMVRRDGKFGLFWACTRYPECRGTVNISEDAEKATRAKWDRDALRTQVEAMADGGLPACSRCCLVVTDDSARGWAAYREHRCVVPRPLVIRYVKPEEIRTQAAPTR